MTIPDYVVDALIDVSGNLIILSNFDRDTILDEVEAVDPDAATWLEDNPDDYDEAVRIAMEEA